MWCVSYSLWPETRRCIVSTSFQLRFIIRHWEGRRKLDGLWWCYKSIGMTNTVTCYVTINMFLIGIRIYCTIPSNYNAAEITMFHTSLLSLVPFPLVVALLQSANKGCSSGTYGSRIAPLTVYTRLYCCPHGFLVRAQDLMTRISVFSQIYTCRKGAPS